MGPSLARDRRRGTWALTEPSAALLWQLGLAWSSLAAVVDAATGHRIVLSGFVLFGPVWVFFTGRWLRTALAGAWATCLVTILGVPDGIWGTPREGFLIASAVSVAVISTLALIITVRICLSLTVTVSMAAACGSQTTPTVRRPQASPTRAASCRQQYDAWAHGPGATQDSGLQAAIRAVRIAESSGNAIAMRSAMSKLMPAAVAAGNAGPIPHCADPAGLYDQYVTAIYKAGHTARTAGGLIGLRKAATSLNGLKAIDSQLTGEVRQALARS